jgi:maltooligosyltrehalose trehalohydrolase
VEVRLVAPEDRLIELDDAGEGYFTGTAGKVEPGAKYFYRLDGRLDRPDPASKFQPDDVHGPTQVISLEFPWTDRQWFGTPLRDYIIYELHVGTLTPEGTFDAIIPRLPELKELGITAIELMPVAQFPGSRNWGYDGVYPFAVQTSYGGPEGLFRLVDACHQNGLAVVLDVVYNHLGPEGNYLKDFGPYFTHKHHTPWGEALNFDGRYNGDVREFFVQNALYWQNAFHIDALRLDAVHAILDTSAVPFLRQLARGVHRQSERVNRRCHLIAESDLNDIRLIRPEALGGHGLDAQWSDDFHHALHVLLTGEHSGYYQDYSGIRPLAKAFRDGFTYTGDYSEHRKRAHGNSPRLTRVKQFVVCAQNHDQVGNRMLGERLTQLVSFESLKLAAGAVLLSPFIPLLFMGEEYGEPAPFQYFISHLDPALVEAVRKGRAEEFASFKWQGEVPDPQSEAVFNTAKINPALRRQVRHRVLYEFHRELIHLRKNIRAISDVEKENMEVLGYELEKVLYLRYWSRIDEVCILCCFCEDTVALPLPVPPGNWNKKLDSAATRWEGSGSAVPDQVGSNGKITLTLSPRSVLLLHRNLER